MTNLLIDEIAQYLEAQGLGVYTSNTNRTIYVGNLPDDVDSAIGIFDTTGLAADINIPIYYPSFQVLIRSTALDLGAAVTESIRILLNDKYNFQFVTNGMYIYACNLVAFGGHIGLDPKGRDTFSLNFQCRVR